MMLAAALPWTFGPAAAAAEIRDVKPSIVRVIVLADPENGHAVEGSGFKIGPGRYITNRHVIQQVLNGGHRVYLAPPTPGSPLVEAEVRASADSDLALIAGPDIPGAVLTLSASVPESGDDVYALGYPGQVDNVLGRNATIAGPPDVTKGGLINSGDGSLENGAIITRVIHSASIWPGNSGGPLVDRCNRVVGVNTWVHVEDGLAQQGVAVATKDVLAFLEKNGVTAQSDPQACIDGAVQVAAAPPPVAASAPPASEPAVSSPPSSAASPVGGIALVVVILAILGVMVALGARFQRDSQGRRRARHEREEDW